MTLDRLWWALGAVIVALAIYICLVPGHELPAAFEWNDKTSHLVGHALMAVYFSGLVARRAWWKIFLFLLLLGSLIEYAQYVMHAGREGDPRDVVANCAGSLLGLAAGWLGAARWPQLAAWLLGRRRAA
jgi:VanZ family protein